MPNFKNMKIIVNDQQPLDDVVKELKRLGYRLIGILWEFDKCNYFVCANKNGIYTTLSKPPSYCDLTTLTELKNMEV